MIKCGMILMTVALTLSGCAGGKITELEKIVQRNKSDVAEMRSIQAEHTAALNEIRSQLGQLGSKLDETQYIAKGKTEELQRTLDLVSSRVPPPPGVPENLLNSDDEKISRINSPAAQEYRSSLQQLRSGNYEPALRGFENFVSQNPGTAFTDNAIFWSGICYEKMDQLDRAIGSYSDVFQRFPAEDFVPVSLLRLAEAFQKMGSKSDAVLTLQKLVDEHPRSAEAVKGRELLADLGKGKKKR